MFTPVTTTYNNNDTFIGASHLLATIQRVGRYHDYIHRLRHVATHRLHPTLPYPRILQCEPLQNEAVDHDCPIGRVSRVNEDPRRLVRQNRSVATDPEHVCGGIDNGCTTHERQFVPLKHDLARGWGQLKERQLDWPACEKQHGHVFIICECLIRKLQHTL